MIAPSRARTHALLAPYHDDRGVPNELTERRGAEKAEAAMPRTFNGCDASDDDSEELQLPLPPQRRQQAGDDDDDKVVAAGDTEVVRSKQPQAPAKASHSNVHTSVGAGGGVEGGSRSGQEDVASLTSVVKRSDTEAASVGSARTQSITGQTTKRRT